MATPQPDDASTEKANPTAVLAEDHARVGVLLDRLTLEIPAETDAVLAETLRAVRCAAERHLRQEERFLFPLFETRLGIGGGGTTVLREEHGEIRRALDRMDSALASGDRVHLAEGVAFFREVNEDHCGREERLLYPMVERLLSLTERRRFVTLLRSESLA